MRLAPLLRRAFDRGEWRIAAAALLLLAAAAMPEITLRRHTFNYMFSFDITQSMNVDDVMQDGVPTSRLALARAATREALHRLPCGSKVGWSIFADYRSFALLEPIEVCANYEILLSTLDKIDGRMRWANASNIGKGLYWSLRNAHQIPDTRVVFITDGQEAPPLRPGQEPMPAVTPGEVGGWVIGVGGDTPSRIPRTNADGVVTGYWTADAVVQAPGQSHEELSELRERYLASLATRTGLDYRRLTTTDALGDALLDTKWAIEAPAPTSLRWLPAALALTLLAWHFLPETGVLRKGLTGKASTRRSQHTLAKLAADPAAR